MTDEETFAALHSLTRYNSTRAQRQEAWAATQVVIRRRESASMRSHPTAPQWRWFDVLNEAPLNWTWPGSRSLERDEVEQLYPGALEAFDTHCTDIPQSRFVFVDRLRLSLPMTGRPHGNVTWVPEMRIWRRMSIGVRARPHRMLEAVGGEA